MHPFLKNIISLVLVTISISINSFPFEINSRGKKETRLSSPNDINTAKSQEIQFYYCPRDITTLKPTFLDEFPKNFPKKYTKYQRISKKVLSKSVCVCVQSSLEGAVNVWNGEQVTFANR